MGFIRIIVGIVVLIIVATVVFGEDRLDKNGFPVGYLPEDLLYQFSTTPQNFAPEKPPLAAPEKPVEENVNLLVPNKQAKRFHINDLPRTHLTPEEAASQQTFLPSQELISEVLGEKTLMTAEEMEYFGVLTPENKGFEETVWQGLNRERAEIMLKRIHETGLKSPQALKLVRRLLLTKSTPPKGESTKNWLAVRAETLQSLNMAEAAYALLKPVKSEQLASDEYLAQQWTEASLMAGDIENACLFVRQYILNSQQPFWRQALMVCQLSQGEKEKLRLSLDLLQEKDRMSNPLFYQLLHAVVENTQSPRLMLHTRFVPLQSALYAAHPSLITPDVMSRLPDMVLRRVSRSQALPIGLRIQAGEQLVNTHMRQEDAKELGKLYDTLAFDALLIKDPLGSAKKEVDGSKARALLWQAASMNALDSTRALSLQALWWRAEQDGLSYLVSALKPSFRQLKPKANLAWFAPEVIRASLTAGDIKQAQAWWRVLVGNKTLSRDLSLQRADLAMAFSLLDNKVRSKTLDDWWKTRTLNDKKGRIRTQRTLAVLDAAGIEIPAKIWQRMHESFNDAHTDQGPGPGPLWLRLVATSLEEKRKAEALLMLVEPLMYVKAQNMSPQGVANVVTGLRFLGLTDEANTLAMEALLSATTESN